MNREHWRSLSRAVRRGRTNGLLLTVNGTYWSLRKQHGRGLPQIIVEPSIIRDRPPTRRIADDLGWARYFRMQAGYLWGDPNKRSRDIAAARACIEDARSVRLEFVRILEAAVKGRLVGPYARQVTSSKLKFWFALVPESGDAPARYEVAIDVSDRKMKARHRPTYDGKVPTHTSNFAEYAIPGDLSAYPGVEFPRFLKDRLGDAAVTLLPDRDVPDVTRVKLIGVLPQTARKMTS